LRPGIYISIMIMSGLSSAAFPTASSLVAASPTTLNCWPELSLACIL
jgi:hypothetical protein